MMKRTEDCFERAVAAVADVLRSRHSTLTEAQIAMTAKQVVTLMEIGYSATDVARWMNTKNYV